MTLDQRALLAARQKVVAVIVIAPDQQAAHRALLQRTVAVNLLKALELLQCKFLLLAQCRHRLAQFSVLFAQLAQALLVLMELQTMSSADAMVLAADVILKKKNLWLVWQKKKRKMAFGLEGSAVLIVLLVVVVVIGYMLYRDSGGSASTAQVMGSLQDILARQTAGNQKMQAVLAQQQVQLSNAMASGQKAAVIAAIKGYAPIIQQIVASELEAAAKNPDKTVAIIGFETQLFSMLQVALGQMSK